jgi:alanine dehydrogenase
MDFLDFDAVRTLASVAQLITPVREVFLHPPQVPAREHYDLGETDQDHATLLIMPAWSNGLVGVKLLTAFPENVRHHRPTLQGTYLLFSRDSGAPLIGMDGRALTLLRTAAVSALAADTLAPPRPRRLLMVGTGALAPYLIDGHCAVRQYESICIWGRDHAKAAALAESLSSAIRSVEAAPELEEAVRSADVICCATSSRQPLLCHEWISSGAHVNLVGGFTPTMREADDATVARADIVIDSADAADCGDLGEPLRKNLITREEIQLLGHPTAARTHDITLFKSVGTAAADLGAASWIYRRSRDEV